MLLLLCLIIKHQNQKSNPNLFLFMKNYIQHEVYKRYLPRWIVLLADFSIIACTFVFIYLLRYNIFGMSPDVVSLAFQLLAGLPFFVLGILIFKPHLGIIRHTTMHEALSLFKANLVLTAGFFLMRYPGELLHINLNIPVSVIFAQHFVSVTLMVSMRFSIKFIYQNYLIKNQSEKINVLIYGAGQVGQMILNVISNDNLMNYRIVGFVDDNPELWNSRIAGIKIFPREKIFSEQAKHLQVKEMILAISPVKIDLNWKREVVDLCLANEIKVSELPDPSEWINGKLGNNMIRSVNIEELLGRDPISINVEKVSRGINGKRVMITGGAGSIGSEIVRQLLFLKPSDIIIVDQAESALFDIQHEILPQLNEIKLTVFVADVTDKYKMHRIFDRCRPEILYHAAAYKHVPMMELQPYEAICNNVGGTKTLADLAVEFQVEKFVMISTDKAVNPTNVMGTTKRICEIYTQSLSNLPGMKTQFITTRFGNVLGSNGSVIPLFKNQIRKGGPVTITHKDIIRYFMTIPEACQLVMEAGFLGHGGEIFLFDMGQPVRIYDLAKKMISLSGFVPDQDIKIVEVGLRPGEKLYEELLADQETTLPTEHKRIMVAKIRPYPYRKAMNLIKLMLEDLNTFDDFQLVSIMKEIVPEFKSNNSKFEQLDNDPVKQLVC